MRMSEQLALINRFKRNAPVDVETLSHALGVPVHYANLDNDTSGMLERINDNSFRITVNSNHPTTRQRFTIAHELGHYMLHRHLIGDGVDENRAYRSMSDGVYKNKNIGKIQETQANKFAVSVLMPDNLLEEVKSNPNYNSSASRAKALGVSEQSYCIRTGTPYEVEFPYF